MKRDITIKINYILDNIIPPVLRDSKCIMYPFFFMLFGRKCKYYLDFKSRFPQLSEEDINNYYEELNTTFIKRDTDLNHACLNRILCEISGNKRILDAAAGSGGLSIRMKKPENHVTALDIVLPEKKDRHNSIRYVKGSITDLPFADHSFDVVVCTHALEHIKDADTALEELRRVCSDTLIVVLPRQREYRYTPDLHLNFYPYQYCVEKLFKGRAEVSLLEGDWFCIEKYPVRE